MDSYLHSTGNLRPLSQRIELHDECERFNINNLPNLGTWSFTPDHVKIGGNGIDVTTILEKLG